MSDISKKFNTWLRAYKLCNGAESAQVLKCGAVWPLKAARAWTKHLKG
jgi:hypothetical protein